MNPTHVKQLQISHPLGNGFIASEHEFFDYLMALSVVDRVRARNASVVIEVNFDFGEN